MDKANKGGCGDSLINIKRWQKNNGQGHTKDHFSEIHVSVARPKSCLLGKPRALTLTNLVLSQKLVISKGKIPKTADQG